MRARNPGRTFRRLLPSFEPRAARVLAARRLPLIVRLRPIVIVQSKVVRTVFTLNSTCARPTLSLSKARIDLQIWRFSSRFHTLDCKLKAAAGERAGAG